MDYQKFYALCSQGNVWEAMEYLRAEQDNSEELALLERQYTERFVTITEKDETKAERDKTKEERDKTKEERDKTKAERDKIKAERDKTRAEGNESNTQDPWIKEAMDCYYEYFRSVLMNHPAEACEKRLTENLSPLLDSACTNMEEAEENLEEKFREKGYFFQGGKTKPYWGPYIWKNTEKRDFLVSLPEGEQPVAVYFMSDFLLLSWSHFATLGKYYTGGWAKPEGLYYVNTGKEPVDTESEHFQVWFLKHEAQHIRDYITYPGLDSINLEYRAKLVELIYNSSPGELILKFIGQAKNDKALPHAYSSYLITGQMEKIISCESLSEDKEKLSRIKPELIQDAARHLFLENSKSLAEHN